jgi:hypothetical protein
VGENNTPPNSESHKPVLTRPMHDDRHHRLDKRAHQAPIQHEVETDEQRMQKRFDLLRQLLCLFLRCLHVPWTGARLSRQEKASFAQL